MDKSKAITLGCAGCRAKACEGKGASYPEFCKSKDLPEDVLREAMKEYKDPEVRRITIAAAETESENYCQMTRLEETVEFAKKLGAKRIGLPHCLGLNQEAGIVAGVLQKNGFEVVSISCKCGEQKKVDVGISEACHNTGVNMCNPILQAKYLNAQNTDLNILVGLYVGHDSMFYKYCEGLVTTLVSKDRVMAHNTVGAIYQADKYLHLV